MQNYLFFGSRFVAFQKLPPLLPHSQLSSPCLPINLQEAVCRYLSVAFTFDKVSQDVGTFLVDQTRKKKEK